MDIVIVGGGYAGLSCATRLALRVRRQRTPVRIRLVHSEPVLVERIRLHQAATGQQVPERRLPALLERAGIELVTGRAEALDPDARAVRVGAALLHWDRLVLALGSQPGSAAVPGALDHAFTLQAEGARALHARLATLAAGARVPVIGGGLSGIEAASEIAERFPRLRVELLTAGRLAEGFGAAGRAHLLRSLQARFGVRVQEDVQVLSVEAGVLRTPAQEIAFDACVWATGFRAPALPRQAGLRVNAAGQVLVDPLLRSVSHPAISAAGDIAAPVLPPGQPVPLGCKSAMPMGAHVGDNLAREVRGEPGRPFDLALAFYCVSLGRRDGLIQWADPEGRLTGRVLTGRRAAWFKEAICQLTWWALVWEAHGWPAVVWKRTGRAPRELAPAA